MFRTAPRQIAVDVCTSCACVSPLTGVCVHVRLRVYILCDSLGVCARARVYVRV